MIRTQNGLKMEEFHITWTDHLVPDRTSTMSKPFHSAFLLPQYLCSSPSLRKAGDCHYRQLPITKKKEKERADLGLCQD